LDIIDGFFIKERLIEETKSMRSELVHKTFYIGTLLTTSTIFVLLLILT